MSGDVHRLLMMQHSHTSESHPARSCLWKTPAHRTKDCLSGQAACSILNAATEDRGGCLSTVCALYRLNLKQELCRLSVVVGTQAEEYVY